MSVSGACNCGAVVFDIRGPLDNVYICHCSICRRYTGSNGIAVIVVDNDRFSWTQGQDRITHWRKPNAEWESHFCSICGSSLPGANDASRMFIPAGLLKEEAEGLKVAHHIWVASKANWDVIGDAGRQHPEAFGP